ncbi:MAG TPA: recombinase family protein [Bacilli bacterium]|nr:recombinase family protein [Bacilli bacterium]
MRTTNVRILSPNRNSGPGNSFDGYRLTKKRVAAYCRVSSDSIDQKTSYEAQVNEYTKRITANFEWEMVKIYADEGISGTSTKNRKQFNEMIEAARSGRIDLILTKSISRFARNTIDCLNYIRELRERHVEIFFEKENIYSSDPKVDFLLTIMSSIAQEEARNTSENVKWNVRKRFSEGTPILNHKRFLGYDYNPKTKQFVINPEGAETVRLIYKMYLDGIGCHQIMKEMERLGRKTGAGVTKWWESSVISILQNEKYAGDLVLQKTVTLDYLTHKRAKNDDLATKYVVENNHEPIIDRDTFNKVQRMMKIRSDAKMGQDKNRAKYTNRYPFSSIIICAECGRTLKRRYWNYGTPAARLMQQCGGYIEGKGSCRAKAIYHDVLEKMTLEMINKVFLNNSKILSTIKEAISKNAGIKELESKLQIAQDQEGQLQEKINTLLELKINKSDMTEDDFNIKYRELQEELHAKNQEVRQLESNVITSFEVNNRLKQIEEYTSNTRHEATYLDTQLLRTFVYRIIAINRHEVIYFITNSKEYSDQEFANMRKRIINLKSIASSSYSDLDIGIKMQYRVIAI